MRRRRVGICKAETSRHEGYERSMHAQCLMQASEAQCDRNNAVIRKLMKYHSLFFFGKALLILTETSTGTDRVHQAAANTEVRPHIFTDNNACGAPIKPVLVPYY